MPVEPLSCPQVLFHLFIFLWCFMAADSLSLVPMPPIPHAWGIGRPIAHPFAPYSLGSAKPSNVIHCWMVPFLLAISTFSSLVSLSILILFFPFPLPYFSFFPCSTFTPLISFFHFSFLYIKPTVWLFWNVINQEPHCWTDGFFFFFCNGNRTWPDKSAEKHDKTWQDCDQNYSKATNLLVGWKSSENPLNCQICWIVES